MSSSTYHNLPEQHLYHANQPQDNTPYSQPYAHFPSAPTPYADEQGSLYPQSYVEQQGPLSAPDANATASVRPSGLKPAVEPHISETPSSYTESDSPGKTHLLSQRNDVYLDWAIKILSVAAAVTFGIWAPISYKITADGNSGNDKAQASLMSEISSMRAEAETAASAQRSAVTALAKLRDQLDNIGLLRAWEFCDGQTVAVCRSLKSSSTNVIEALSSLGGLQAASSTIGQATSAASSAPTSGSSDSHSAGGSRLGGTAIIAVVLGSVFGGIVIVGLIVGVMAKRRRLRVTGKEG
ncbi:hypothetical protein C7974DRAFT_417585 [Boeremia exigua]|uniref:uncharacterized protein n=1 Tax=Boeremia exigua TaxID=749465 RepID=UPI001E8D6DAC|nr:uncharacterized protein C7974DRAFT_417585 [Boeremia exigua]KAH6613833.1 hypothetical protein C7974DRAFT_417585 [Boeremia exigua]